MLFVTARDDEVDRIVGLEIGGDDYLTKPFSPREMVARVKAVLRRTQETSSGEVLTAGSLRLDPAARTVSLDGRPVALTLTEFNLLAALLRTRGRVLGRAELLAQAWGQADYGTSRTVDVHVAQLRSKLGEACPIETVRGVGYRVAQGSTPMTRWGVRTLLTAATVGVAVLALLFAAVLTSPLVRTAAERSARESLARDADLFARLPLAERLTEREAGGVVRPAVTRRGIAVGVVTPDGEASGAALALTEAERQVVLGGTEVSTDGELGGEEVLVEARPLGNGAAVVLASRAADVDESVGRQRRRLLLALALGLLVALAAGALVARQLGRPLAGLAATARRLTAGERGVTDDVPTRGPREVAEVAEALRQLDRALATSEERQRRFLLSVSHELRTPLTSIRGYAESLVDGAFEPDELPGVGETLVRESIRLERYVADLLALARLEADDFTLAARRRRPGPAARRRRRGLGRPVRPGGTDARGRRAVALVVRTDAGRVRQVLDVLTDNALRVCAPGSRVVWALASRPDGVRLEVRDSGPGLTEADAADAFTPGVLHDRYADSRPVGHGLGLAIAHGLVVRLGGTIRLTRAPEGGAAFEVDLPG